MKLFLIRHGESVANLEHCFAGQTDSKLTPLGIQQAQSIQGILKEIPFDKVYSSDLSRAHDTQKNALPGYDAELTPLLREYDVGTWGGKPIAEAAKIKNINYADYGGETWDMVNVRVDKFLTQLQDQPYEYVAAFTHGGFVMNAAQYVLGARLARGKLTSDNCSIQVLEYKDGSWRILAWNYMRPVIESAESVEKMGVLV